MTTTIDKPDFFFAFLEKGKVINASLLPDTMTDEGLSFSYDSPEGDNYIIDMSADGVFSAERFEWSDEEDEWVDTAEYGHEEAKAIALQAGIIKLRRAK